MIWQQTRIAPETSHHILNGQPLYAARFDEVLSFHEPGLAAVRVGDQAWHINSAGFPAYAQRFDRTFGYYEGRAAVVQGNDWWHILPNGLDLYPDRYHWAGNFQGGFCTVHNGAGAYFHIDDNGRPAYQERWRYAGDFKDSLAVVQSDAGLSTHIKTDGTELHGRWFLDLDVFHKGYARARDASGWAHLDRKGCPCYARRFAMIEPFYNGQARVESFDGTLEVIDETGQTVTILRKSHKSPFSELSGKLVGYWKTKTIAAAVELGVFEVLGKTAEQITAHCLVSERRMLRLLRALQELQLVELDGEIWSATSQGCFLRREDPLTLADAAREYAGPLCSRWDSLAEALRSDDWQPSVDIFKEVTMENERTAAHHRMLRSYARHDYTAIVPTLPISPGNVVIDAGGGTGTLARLVADALPTVSIQLLDHPQVLALAEPHPRITILGRDLFSNWETSADVVILARVLHDWDDERALLILRQAHAVLRSGGRVVIIEMMREEESSAGALCDLHLLSVTGGEERTEEAYINLLHRAGITVTEKAIRSSSLPSVLIGEVKS